MMTGDDVSYTLSFKERDVVAEGLRIDVSGGEGQWGYLITLNILEGRKGRAFLSPVC